MILENYVTGMRILKQAWTKESVNLEVFHSSKETSDVLCQIIFQLTAGAGEICVMVARFQFKANVLTSILENPNVSGLSNCPCSN